MTLRPIGPLAAAALALALAAPAAAQARLERPRADDGGAAEGAPASAVASVALPSEVPAWRELGPTVFGGRIVDIAIHPQHPSRLWVAGASGGLWYTENHGTTWRCLFEHEPVIAIGDIAVDPRDARTIWIGTGECNNQRSSYAGDGVYKSTDGGETWVNVGLRETHHIGRVAVDPVDSDKVFVAALGRLYTPNEERGLYRTTDGGATWERVLFVGPDVGVTDVVIDPVDPSYVYAATYERRRRAWHFDGEGPGSGVWRSTDGGATFERCAGGLPGGDLDRIGLDVHAADPRIVVAIVPNANRVPIDTGPVAGLTTEFEGGRLVVKSVAEKSGAAELEIAVGDVLVRLGDEDLSSPFGWVKVLARFEERNERAKEERVDVPPDAREAADEPSLTLVVRRGDVERSIEVTLSKLFHVDPKEPETREIGGEIYRSEDRGAKWTKVNEEPVAGDPPYYYGQIRIDPTDASYLYACCVPLMRSKDGGKTWDSIAGSVHVDHHAVVVDPSDPSKVWLGNDGGLHVSYDRGETWMHLNNLPLAQFYAVSVDDSEPFRVFGGTQDNGSWGGPHTSRDSRGIHPVEWFYVGGGDGFYTVTDPRDPRTVYGESQFGAIYRRDLVTGVSKSIRPRIEGETLRFNWNSPIVISHHNPEIVYFGANRLFKSFNRGDDWPVRSPDLTTNDAAKIAGNVPHCTITTIAESKLDPGLVLAGTDDGNVQLSTDGCYTWTNLTGQFPGAPAHWWVSRVELSRHARERAYVAFTGYREDDQRPLLYRTEELGQGRAWHSISADLPAGEAINVVREDPRHADVLYVGTERGAYVTWNGGAAWHRLGAGLPSVAVHDLAVQDRDGVVVVATHGRGFWALDVDALRGMRPEAETAVATLLPVGDLTRWARLRATGGYGGGDAVRYGENAPQHVTIVVHVGAEPPAGTELALHVEDERGRSVARFEVPRTAGSHEFHWELRARAERPRGRARTAPDGAYTAVLKVGDEVQRRTFELRPDPLLSER